MSFSIFYLRGKRMQFLKLTSIVVLAASILAGCGGLVSATIGGTVSGLTLNSTLNLVLAVNGVNVETLSVPYNATDNTFIFNTTVETNSTYNVTVGTPLPTGLICTPTNGAGTISSGGGDVTNIAVACQPATGVGVAIPVSVVGLGAGLNVVLLLNNNTTPGYPLTVTTPNVTVNFPQPLLPGTPYGISVQIQPTGQTCVVGPPSTGIVPATGGVSPAALVVQCNNNS
jgi:hypothetical protein